MTPLDMTHEIMMFATMNHQRELHMAMHDANASVHARQAVIHAKLGDLTQVKAAYAHIAEMIESARLPVDPAIMVHPSRYLALAKNVDGYLQELGFRSIEKPIFDAFKNARAAAKAPAF